MRVSESLRQAVKEALAGGTTRYVIAKRARMDHSGLSRFLIARRDIRLSNVDRLAEALGLELRSKSAETEV